MELKGAFAMTSFFFLIHKFVFFTTIIKYPTGDTKISSNKGFIITTLLIPIITINVELIYFN